MKLAGETQAELVKYALIGGAVLFAVWYAKKKAEEVLPKVADALNPVNPGNIANQGFESVYKSVTGSTQSPGADIYDITHPDIDSWHGPAPVTEYELPPMAGA